MDYRQAGGSPFSPSLATWWTSLRGAISGVGFGRVFRLGMQHIAEGTDHLLFLLVLLLPAPLLVAGGRWAGSAGARLSVTGILKIVTAFTVGHSITLAFAASAVVSLPDRPVEVLIAVSILVSAIHALRPIFPGKEAIIAGFFGLIHGLAFAATLADLGLTGWARAAGVLAFNLGIETMQLIVVALTMPSLLLLSRTRGHRWLRVGGALFAGVAALGWIGERLADMPNPAEIVVEWMARHALWIAATLFMMGIASLRWRGGSMLGHTDEAASK